MYDWELPDHALKAWVRLRQASDAVERVLETSLTKQDATLAQIDVLGVLSFSNVPLTPGTIASYTFRRAHSASAQLIRMSSAGLVKRARSKDDQRVVRIKIQPKGEQLLKETRQAGLGQARKLLKSALSDEEIKHLDRLLRKVRDRALRELGTKAEPLPETVNVSGSCLGWREGKLDSNSLNDVRPRRSLCPNLRTGRKTVS
jgi:DNA-binding MarR family transcriptional regulator